MKRIIRRNMNRIFIRFALLCVSVILAAIAVGQAQRGLQKEGETIAAGTENVSSLAPGFRSVDASRPVPLAGNRSLGGFEEPADVYEEPTENYTEPAEIYTEPVPLQVVDDPESQWGDVSTPDEPAYEENHSPEPETAILVANHDESIRLAGGDESDGYVTQLDQATEAISSDTVAGNFYQQPEVADERAASMPDLPLPAPALNNSDYEPAAVAEPSQDLATVEPALLTNPNAVEGRIPYHDDNNTANGFGGASIRMADESPTPKALEPEPLATNQDRFISRRDPLVAGTPGTGRPDDKLIGRQSPALTISKSVPDEIQIGKPAKFEIKVRNVGPIPAHDVQIRDEIPHGTELKDTQPSAGRAGDGAVVWEMGTIKPDEEVTVAMEVMATDEGEVGSVATVSFQASASAKTVATRPELEIEHTSPTHVLIGEEIVFSIAISNPGTGDAHNVVVQERVPSGLRHSAGSELEYEIGTLHRGETRHLELTLLADQPGVVDNVLVAYSDTDLVVEDHCKFEVVAPMLRVAINGPGKRFLQRKAVYDLTVANPGTAAARNVEVLAHLPRGLRFLSTNHQGQYDAQQHAIRWSLEELPAGEMGTVELRTMPKDMGRFKIRLQASAGLGLDDSAEQRVEIEGIAALLFTVTDASDPIEVGGQTTYEVRVVNQGSKTATNLQLVAAVPDGMEAINGEGPTRGLVEGGRIVFDPLTRLAPQADTTFKMHVKGTTPGDKRFTVQLMSDDVVEPVTKEESTKVYADE